MKSCFCVFVLAGAVLFLGGCAEEGVLNQTGEGGSAAGVPGESTPAPEQATARTGWSW